MVSTLLTAQQLKDKVLSIPSDDGTIFSVVFVKRTTGEVRKMVCRRGVKKYLRGGEAAYNPKDHDLLCVFDLEKYEYRSINCQTIQEVHLHGEVFKLDTVRG